MPERAGVPRIRGARSGELVLPGLPLRSAMRLPVFHSVPLLLCALASAACSHTASDRLTAEESAYSSNAWAPLLRCDDGAAVLDVNTAERRDFQIVIRDSNIVDYFQSTFPGIRLTNSKGE